MIPGFFTRHSENIAAEHRISNPPIVTGYLDSLTNHIASLTAYDRPDIFLRGESDKDAFLALKASPDTNLSGYVVRFKDPKSGRDAIGSITPRASKPLPISDEGGKIGVNLGENNGTLIDLGLYGGNTFLPVVLGSTTFGEASTSTIYSQDQLNMLNEAGAASTASQTSNSSDPTNDIMSGKRPSQSIDEKAKRANGRRAYPNWASDLESKLFTPESIQAKRDILKVLTMQDVIPQTGLLRKDPTVERKNVIGSNANMATYNKKATPPIHSGAVRHD